MKLKKIFWIVCVVVICSFMFISCVPPSRTNNPNKFPNTKWVAEDMYFISYSEQIDSDSDSKLHTIKGVITMDSVQYPINVDISAPNDSVRFEDYTTRKLLLEGDFASNKDEFNFNVSSKGLYDTRFERYTDKLITFKRTDLTEEELKKEIEIIKAISVANKTESETKPVVTTVTTQPPVKITNSEIENFSLEDTNLPQDKNDILFYYVRCDAGGKNPEIFLINNNQIKKYIPDNLSHLLEPDYQMYNLKFSEEEMLSSAIDVVPVEILYKLNELEDCLYDSLPDTNIYGQAPHLDMYSYAVKNWDNEYEFRCIKKIEGAGYLEIYSPYTQDIINYINDLVDKADFS